MFSLRVTFLSEIIVLGQWATEQIWSWCFIHVHFSHVTVVMIASSQHAGEAQGTGLGLC